MVIAPWVLWAMFAITLASAVYSYYSLKKAQKQNRPEPNQNNGTIADEGVSFSDLAGSPHVYTNITWEGNQSTEPIKSKGGKK
jgi:hypothetical protein